MICLLGMVAVVWSRPPRSSSRNVSHPQLALASEDAPMALPKDPAFEPLPDARGQQDAIELPHAANVPSSDSQTLPALVLVREVKPYKLTFKFEGHRLFFTFHGKLDEGREAECKVAADYHLTKDSMVYGIITSAEYTASAGEPESHLEANQGVQQLFDQPFAFRYRLDEGALTVKDFKIGPIAEPSDFTEVLMPFIVGCYRPAAPASL
jgi:hypothetical protein